MVRIDEYWASFFGLGLAKYLRPEPKVVPHAHLSDERRDSTL